MPDVNPGEGAVNNPWAAYGLNPDGTPLKAAEPEKAPDPIQVELASVKSKLAAAEAQLSKLPTDFAGTTKKLEIVDKLVAALTGGETDPKAAEYKKIWSELKEVSKVAAPGFYKQMVRYEQNPDAAEGNDEPVARALAQARLADLNNNAHNEVLTLAKGVFRGLNAEELSEAVYPFEATMTEMINSNPELSRRFVNGDMSVVKEMFQRLAKPHLAGRLRQKQETTRVSSFPKAMPRSQGAPATEGNEPPKRNLTTRQGRETFHKAAVGRFFDRAAQRDE